MTHNFELIFHFSAFASDGNFHASMCCLLVRGVGESEMTVCSKRMKTIKTIFAFFPPPPPSSPPAGNCSLNASHRQAMFALCVMLCLMKFMFISRAVNASLFQFNRVHWRLEAKLMRWDAMTGCRYCSTVYHQRAALRSSIDFSWFPELKPFTENEVYSYRRWATETEAPHKERSEKLL